MRHVSRCTARREVFSADLKLSILRVESRREFDDEFQVIDPQRRTLDDQTDAWYDQLTTIGWQQTLTAGSIRCSSPSGTYMYRGGVDTWRVRVYIGYVVDVRWLGETLTLLCTEDIDPITDTAKNDDMIATSSRDDDAANPRECFVVCLSPCLDHCSLPDSVHSVFHRLLRF